MNNNKTNGFLDQYRYVMLTINNFSTETIKTYLSCINNFINYAQDQLNVSPLEIDGKKLSKYFINLKEIGVDSGRLTHYRAAIKGFFKFLHDIEIIASNPAEKLFVIRREASVRYKPVPAEVMIDILSQIDKDKQNGKRDYLMTALLWTLGLRSLELRTIRKSQIKILNADERIALITIDGKGAKQRALFIVDKLYDRVVEYIKDFNKDDLLFPGKNKNKPLDDSTVNRRIRKYIKKSNHDIHLTAHMLRHSFATELYNAGVPIEAIRIMLGHGSIRETSIYIHPEQKQIDHALSLLTITGGFNAA